MQIPIELFFGFVGAFFAFFVLGLVTKRPVFSMITGILLLSLTLVTTELTMGYTSITNSTQISQVLQSNNTMYHYVVESSNTDLPTHNGTGAQWGRSEGLKTTGTPSILLGDKVQCVDVYLAKVGSPPSPDVPQYVIIGIWTVSGIDPIQTIGAMPAPDLTTTLTFYTFCVPEGSERTLQSGDRIGFQYRAGNSSNYVLTRSMDVTGGVTFDTTNTVRVNAPRGSGFTTGVDTGDLMLRVYDFEVEYAEIQDFDQTSEPNIFEFTEFHKTIFALFSALLMIVSAILWRSEQTGDYPFDY